MEPTEPPAWTGELSYCHWPMRARVNCAVDRVESRGERERRRTALLSEKMCGCGRWLTEANVKAYHTRCGRCRKLGRNYPRRAA